MAAVEMADESDACYPGDAELTCIIYAIYVFNIRGSFVGYLQILLQRLVPFFHE